MSEPITPTLEYFRHILHKSLDAHINETIVVSWMMMEPQKGKIAYVIAPVWPLTPSKNLTNLIQKAGQDAETFFQNKFVTIPDTKQGLLQQAIQINPKSSHNFFKAKTQWQHILDSSSS